MQASIILTVYNKAKYVEATLRSIRAQTFPHFEVVIVDDGSTDDSVAVIERFDDPRFRIIRQHNQGVSAARNHGVQAARSDTVLFFDADDWMHPAYVATQLATMAAHPGHRFFATGFIRFTTDTLDAREWPSSPVGPPEIVTDLPAKWASGQTFITSSVAVRRSALLAEDYIFPLNESFGEDMDLWFRLAEKHALVFSAQPLIGYRENALDSLTEKKPRAVVATYILRLEARAERLPPQSGLRRSTLRFTADARISLARALLAAGQRRDSCKALFSKVQNNVRRPRWWVTIVMALVFPRSAVLAWEQRGIRRTQKRI